MERTKVFFDRLLTLKKADKSPLSRAVGIHPKVKFLGSWRPYQERVIRELEHHLEDNFVHIVAAPGAGKTVLGLEIIQRLGGNALVLTPRTAIREQWLKTFSDLFLEDQDLVKELTSSQVNDVRALTVLTYQSLGGMQDTNDNENITSKVLPELIDRLRAAKIKTLVLDESHHLTDTWGLAVRQLAQSIDGLVTISLTATPPYDYDKKRWGKFIELCGEIDAEIAVPELVKSGNLCPHQDYIYFNSLSGGKQDTIGVFRKEIKGLVDSLKKDSELKSLIKKEIQKLEKSENNIKAERAEYIISLIFFADDIGIKVSNRLYRKLGLDPKFRPENELLQLEIILRDALSPIGELFKDAQEFKEKLSLRLKKLRATSDGALNLVSPDFINKELTWSSSKLESIESISQVELDELGKSLRLVVLTDWICDEAVNENFLPDTWESIGVYPIFHSLQKILNPHGMLVGAISGRLIILPKPVVELLKQGSAIDNNDIIELNTQELPSLSENYEIVSPRNDIAKATLIIQLTQLFNEGHLHALVGTSGLLGEGWDSPAVNSLILASYVGSFMLSNQMRGRALRSSPIDHSKVSNIWHLATVDNSLNNKGGDFGKLTRRFDAFVGIDAEEAFIESGMARMKVQFSGSEQKILEAINVKTIEDARDRHAIIERWKLALGNAKEGELADVLELPKLPISYKIINGSCADTTFYKRTLLILRNLYRGVRYDFIDSFLMAVLLVTKAAMAEGGFIKEDGAKIKLTPQKNITGTVALTGGWRDEQATLARALEEIFSPDEDSRYLIRVRVARIPFGYFAVPSKLSVNNKLAEKFKSYWEKNISSCELIYTRSKDGNHHLVKAKMAYLQKSNEDTIQAKRKWF